MSVFICPRCGRASHNPTDAHYGYCGACHDWTGPRCEHGHVMRVRERFALGHEQEDSPQATAALKQLAEWGVELTGEDWVLWYCRTCDLAIAQPAKVGASLGGSGHPRH